MILECPGCKSQDHFIFYRQRQVPIDSCKLLASYDEALAFPRGNMNLGFCKNCGFIWNTAFDTSLKDPGAGSEETQGYSKRFRDFQSETVNRLYRKYHLRDKTILEIGCGQSDFLYEICRIGNNRGIGIDPNLDEEGMASPTYSEITYVKDYFSERYAHLLGDFVVCRHMLEHIQPVYEFVRLLHRCLNDRRDAVVFFEVPDMMRILQEGAFWDIYYEHSSYFTAYSLTRLFRAAGFNILDLNLDFDNQYLLLECNLMNPIMEKRKDSGGPPELLKKAIEKFNKNHQDKISYWKKVLESVFSGKRRAVLWGSGSKSAAFLHALGIGDKIDYIVNINPRQQGRYVAGSGQQIVAPEFLKSYRPDLVISMNQIYLGEIRKEVVELGLTTDVIAL